MKIRAIIPNTPGHASNWWRIERPLKMLCKYGHDATFHAFDNLTDVDFSDALVIIHRIIPDTPKAYIKNLRKRGAKSIVYSLDDLTFDADVLETYLTECGGLTSFAINRIIDRIPKQIETISLCDAVLVTNVKLGMEVLDKVATQNVIVLGNALDTGWYTDTLSLEPSYIGMDNTVYIGYASGRRPTADLVEMAAAWKIIDKEFANVRFVVAGWQPEIIDSSINLDKKIRIPWRSLEEWPKSMQVDIGCCPLANTRFNLCKSPIKYYEYTMAGAATIVSNVRYPEVVTNRITGFMATDTTTWYEALRLLIYSKVRRKDLQETAQYEITNYLSLDACIKEWERKFMELLG